MSFPKISLFRQDRWKAAQFDTERLEALQELETKLALDEERNPCHVKFWPQAENSKNLPGEYRVNPLTGTKEIRINPEIVENEKPYKAVETQIKCSRQAYQEHAIEGVDNSYTAVVASWKTNKEYYTEHPGNTNSPESVMHKYQPLEVDKSNAAYSGMEWMYKDYYPDADYLDYRTAENEREEKERSYAEGVLWNQPGNSVEDKAARIIQDQSHEDSLANEARERQLSSAEQSGSEMLNHPHSEENRNTPIIEDSQERTDNQSESESKDSDLGKDVDREEDYYYGYGL